jgi:hypothetical protein
MIHQLHDDLRVHIVVKLINQDLDDEQGVQCVPVTNKMIYVQNIYLFKLCSLMSCITDLQLILYLYEELNQR